MNHIVFVDWSKRCFYTFSELVRMSGIDEDDDIYYGDFARDFEDDVIDWADLNGIKMLSVSTDLSEASITELN